MPKLVPSLALLLLLTAGCGGPEASEEAPEPSGPYALGDVVRDLSGPGLAGTVRLSDLDVTPEKARAVVLDLAGDGADLAASFEDLASMQDSDGDYDEDRKAELIARAGRHFGLVASDDRLEALETPQAVVDWIVAAKDSPRVLMIWASGCDTCKRVYNDKVTEALGELGARMLVVASHPYDTAEMIRERVEGSGYPWKIVLDQDQHISTRFGAERTPHMVVLDAEGKVRYSGGVDSAPDIPRGDEELRDHLTNAVRAVQAGREVEVQTSDAIGCPLPKAEAEGA